MALARVKTWIAADVLTASDLNAEFSNIIDNSASLISPLTAALDANGLEIILDADADTIEAVLDLRMTCLDRHLGELRAVVDVLSGDVDGGVVSKAPEATASISDLVVCADVERLGKAAPEPDDPATRARRDEIRDGLTRARAATLAGKYEQSHHLASEAVATSRELKADGLLAEALDILGRNHSAQLQLPEAERHLHQIDGLLSHAHDETTASRESRRPGRLQRGDAIGVGVRAADARVVSLAGVQVVVQPIYARFLEQSRPVFVQ